MKSVFKFLIVAMLMLGMVCTTQACAAGEGDYADMCEKLIVPAAPDTVFAKRSNVAYGTVEKRTYYSKTAERDTPVNVILPPNYSKDKKYPVLYILHGFTDTQDWMLRDDVALVNMLGNLTADGEIKEMIVVLPYIFCSREQQFVNGFDISASPSYDNFINDLKTDLLSFIDSNYPILEGRENRAITGFSMGGRESLFIGVQMSDVFGYVGAACPAPGLTPGENLTFHPGQLKEDELKYDRAKGVPLVTFISRGGSDNFVGESPKAYCDFLTKNGERCLFHIVPNGGHNASSVKQHLYNYTRMIFAETKAQGGLTFDSLEVGTNTLTAAVTNSGADCEAYTIAAYYDVRGILEAVSTMKVAVKSGENKIELENKRKGDTVRAFLWSDLTGMQPVTEYIEKEQKAMKIPDNAYAPVPNNYFSKIDNGGKIEVFNYTAKDYITNAADLQKSALVYLPNGYDSSKKYDVLYLLHGGSDSEICYFTNAGKKANMPNVDFSTYDYSSSKLKSILDNMIANGDVKPCIVCTPTYQSPYDTTEMKSTAVFYKELVNDLIPALETKYSTYYDGSDAKKSRMHRAMGGFSMGSATTWHVFANALDEVGLYMPISGDCWCVAQGGGGNRTAETVDFLENVVKDKGMTSDDFYMYAGCGNTTDVAYNNMVPQIEEMKKRTNTFVYCDNFADGNFYFAIDDAHSHTIDTTYSIVYNALPKLFADK